MSNITSTVQINNIFIFINKNFDFECSCGFTTAVKTKFKMHLVRIHDISDSKSIKKIMELENLLLEETAE